MCPAFKAVFWTKKEKWVKQLLLLHGVELEEITKNVVKSLGQGSNNQNGNLPLGPSLNGTNFQTFFYPTFSFAIESYIYETDFTLDLSQKYHF